MYFSFCRKTTRRIIFLLFILLNYWNLTDRQAEILPVIGNSGKLYTSESVFFSSEKCIFHLLLSLIDSISEYNKHFFLSFYRTTTMTMFFNFHSGHAINRCWQNFDCLECDSNCQHNEKQGWIYWKAKGVVIWNIGVYFNAHRTSQCCVKWLSPNWTSIRSKTSSQRTFSLYAEPPSPLRKNWVESTSVNRRR